MQPRACGGEALEAGRGAHALRERALCGSTDDGSVGERVGEREAELDEVGPRSHGGPRRSPGVSGPHMR